MKIKAFTLITMILFPSVCLAVTPLMAGSEKDACYAKIDNRHEGENCIALQWKKSNKEVNRVLEKKLTSIINDSNFMDPFNSKSEETTGSVFQKRLSKSQKTWERYKKDFCLAVASQIGEEGFDYQPTIEQCEININKRRIEEINLMGDLPQ
ncbi:lysozyme inhibitor LprI family protein [Winslowiella iniecta]|uniref:Lysozyme inhibitor LprI-like N-terminal domain-containing protein n=1 Tax=Winslowiella iniecta TaxID=1560201 RepID=A0A0L7SY28_9GAMM|nr:lysozyme inhibitor LprI family protein [Winslowiella iniecta]KOC87710.1 hypothetical protein NG43_21160 [Winslowiella iniecta]KOC88054.1 hypothetical protein NG42_17660 [Winslowiella iniecta]